MKVVLATGNRHKQQEFSRIWPHTEILIPADLGIDFDHEETGSSFFENALGKAQHLFELCDVPVIADDSGLCVDALGGAPGIYSARFGEQELGRPLDQAAKNELCFHAWMAKRNAQHDSSAVWWPYWILIDSSQSRRVLKEPSLGRKLAAVVLAMTRFLFLRDSDKPSRNSLTKPKTGSPTEAKPPLDWEYFSFPPDRVACYTFDSSTNCKETPVHSDLPARPQVREEDTWDLTGLYANDEAWEKAFEQYKKLIPGLATYKGSLGDSAEQLETMLRAKFDFERAQDRLAEYAELTHAQDVGHGAAQDRVARLTSSAAQAEAELAYFEPELMAIQDATMAELLASPKLAEYRVYLGKLLRMKPYVLGEGEERIMSLQAEPAQTAEKAFSSLLNSDLDFGSIDTPEGSRPLTQSSLISLLQKSDSQIREKAYTQFFSVLDNHKQVLAALLSGGIQQDVFTARVRGFDSARAAALFPDKVPEPVYDNLISTVRKALPAVHKFYSIRARALGIERLKHYDAYVPLVTDVKVEHSYDKAVDLITPALAPLGDEYCSTLREGLLGRWVDRYENKGKRSGAFSAGTYDSVPFILMNYENDNVQDVFTLAHEGGHSMHSWYAKSNNPYAHYNYTIFEAEVASTFNEQLLVDHLLKTTEAGPLKTYLIANQVQGMVKTIFRQTMFAEFEKLTHEAVENGEALTIDSLRSIYRGLLEAYFGPDVDLLEVSDLEFTRVPHFYWAFYVYKYATGLSAAISLSQMVLGGGVAERDRYLDFLKAGGSKYPLESLQTAGVDMSSPEAIEIAMRRFTDLVNDLDTMI